MNRRSIFFFLAHLIVLATTLVIPKKIGRAETLIYSPFPGDKDLSQYINYNYPGSLGGGLHAIGNNIPGIDINSDDGLFYMPFYSCDVKTMVDTVGEGGNGVVAKEGPLKMMAWHFDWFDSKFLELIKEGNCVQAHTLVGKIGESLTHNGRLTTFSATAGYVHMPKHAHYSLGSTKQWPSNCANVYRSMYYWTNPACISTTWGENVEMAAKTSINVSVVIEEVPLGNPSKELEAPVPNVNAGTLQQTQHSQLGITVIGASAIIVVLLIVLYMKSSIQVKAGVLLALVLLIVGISTEIIKPKQANALETNAPITTAELKPIDAAKVAQIEQVEITIKLPEKQTHAANYSAPTGGECALNTNWPDSIRQWCPYITASAKKHNVDPTLIAAMIMQESGGNHLVINNYTCATGAMQVMPSDGGHEPAQNQWGFVCQKAIRSPEGLLLYKKNYDNGRGSYYFVNRPTIAQLQDPEFNIEFGTAYLSGLINRYGSEKEALRYYAGPGYGNDYINRVRAIQNKYKTQPT